MTNPKIFFSYSREDGDFVLELARKLRAEGVYLWLDQLDIKAGELWDQSVEKALETSECLIIVLSQSSVDSPNVMDEVSFALESDKQVVPVLKEKCKIPFRLRRVQHVDFTTDYDAGFAKLLDSVRPDPDAETLAAEPQQAPAAATAAPIEAAAPAATPEATAAPAAKTSSVSPGLIGGIAAAAVVLGLLVYVMTSGVLGPGAASMVPNLRDATEADARDRLVAEGLTPGTTRLEPSSVVRAGNVIDTEPAAGTTPEPEQDVVLVVSSGAWVWLGGAQPQAGSVFQMRKAGTAREKPNRSGTALDAVVKQGEKIEIIRMQNDWAEFVRVP